MPVQGLHDQLTNITDSLGFVIPELILVAAIIAVVIAGLTGVRAHLALGAFSITTAVASIVFIALSGFQYDIYLFNRMIHRDGLADFLMILVDVSVILTCLMSLRRKETRSTPEYYAFLLAIALGAHLLLMSGNLVMIFLSLELISLSSYVLAGYSFDRVSSEGSLKYFFFGSVASAIMLYGFSLLYGFTGSVDPTSPQFLEVLAREESPLLLIAGVMSLSGFLFKMAAVPMHPWAPDVYEAAPMPVIAYLSVAPKLAGLGILVKFIVAMQRSAPGSPDWLLIVAIIAILTITAGNLAALWQKNAKRMMAYSSIAHSGFLLVGIAAFLPHAIEFMLFYAAVYLLMNYSVFLFLAYFEEHGIDTMPTFSGTGKRHIAAATGLTVSLVALTGLPPTAGFTAKLLIFSGLLDGYTATGKSLLLGLLVVGLLNTVISLFYYMRIPYYAFLRQGSPASDIKKNASFENFLGLFLVVLIVALFFIPGLLMRLIYSVNFVL